MAKFIAKHNIENPEDLKKFNELGYIFREDLSSETEYIFERIKMARGEMAKFIAKHNIENPEDLKKFNELGYIFREDLSSETEYIFERIY